MVELMKVKILGLLCLLLGSALMAQNDLKLVDYKDITTGAEQTENYLPLVKNKHVALVAHQASLIGKVHLADSLLRLGVNIEAIFCPEHGFRGNNDAGAAVANEVDSITGIPVISLYGKHKKPSATDMENIDVVVFDLQDVGVRFYTYLSTMTYVMEACAELNIPVILLDRPNPNGFLTDGPVLQSKHKSFVGLHPIPIAHGMTLGELALMIQGEQWIEYADQLELTVVPLQHYNRNLVVKLPVKPSPNLPTWQSVYLYPSLCLFEGTEISVGRGTDYPFEVYGSPYIKTGSLVFVPEPKPGSSLHPKLEGQVCYGQFLRGYAENYNRNHRLLNLSWLINAYENAPDTSRFFNSFFEKLAGTDSLRLQIQAGYTENQIRESWEKELNYFRLIRDKYLLYP